MNKKNIVLLLFLLPAIYGYGQISWNIKAGTNLSNITTIGDTDIKLGYQLGVGADYFFNDNWGIQPSLMLVSKGYKKKGNYYIPPQEDPFELKYDRTENRIYAELPIMLAYRFNISNNIKMILNGGGFVSYGIGGKLKNKIIQEDGSVEKESSNTFSHVDKFDTGIGAGTSFEYKNRYIFGLTGEWGLKPVFGDSKNQTYGLNIGYKF